MGFKSVKEHYRIGHAVQVVEGKGICIGSPYIHDIIVIGMDGVVKKRYEDRRSNEDLWRYQQEFDADPAKLKQLVQSADAFAASITVYTYDGGRIIEKKCETPGWPNVTHDGDMMFENTFSTDKAVVIGWAKRNAEAAVSCDQRLIAEAEKDLAKHRAQLSADEADLAKLNADYA